MLPDKIVLHRLDTDRERTIRAALATLQWQCTTTIPDAAPWVPTPDAPISLLVLPAREEAPSFTTGAAPAILWILGQGDSFPGNIGSGVQDFVRLPAPREEIAHRAQVLVHRLRREGDLRRIEADLADQIHGRSAAWLAAASEARACLDSLRRDWPVPNRGTRPGAEAVPAALGRLGASVEALIDAANTRGGMRIHLGPTYLRSVIEEVETWAVPLLRGLHQEISVQIAPDASVLCADHKRVVQVLHHMIEAALEGASPGSRIELTATADPEATGFARISVAERDGRGTGRSSDGPGAAAKLAGAITGSMGGRWYMVRRPHGGLESRAVLPLWRSRAARIAVAQAALASPSSIPGGHHVVRIVGEQANREIHSHPGAFVLSPGELLLISDRQGPGRSLGVARDFREPGSLARALEPKLAIRLQPAA